MIRHDGRYWFELVGETVGAICVVETRFWIDMTTIIISKVNRLIRAYVRHRTGRFLLGRRCPVEHWEGRIIARVAMLFEHSVTQSSPFSYDNLACHMKSIWHGNYVRTIIKKQNTTCWSKLKCVEFRIEIQDIIGRQVNKFARITTPT